MTNMSKIPMMTIMAMANANAKSSMMIKSTMTTISTVAFINTLSKEFLVVRGIVLVSVAESLNGRNSVILATVALADAEAFTVASGNGTAVSVALKTSDRAMLEAMTAE